MRFAPVHQEGRDFNPPLKFLQNKIKEKGIRWRFLSTITIFIAVIAVVGYLGFQGIKSFQLRSLNTGLRNKDSDMVDRVAKMGVSQKLLGRYVCDLYRLRAYYITGETDKFEQMLRHMIESEYPDPADKKSFLETYFHTFLIKQNRKYADWLLDAIRKTGDEKFIRYNEQSYAVMLDGKSDLIESMVEDINSKKYYGFALGVILFMVAKQYSYLGDSENELIYLQTAKSCFHPKAVYMPVVDKWLKDAEAGA